MPLHLPEVEHHDYARPPIALALCQVRFPPILSIGQQQSIADFQEKIRHRFPTFGVEEQIQVGPGQPLQRQSNWRFTDLDEKWAVTLATDFLTLETIAYAGRDELFGQWTHVLTALVETLGPSQQSRLGLRYVNEIRPEQVGSLADWRKYVRDELSGVLASELATQGLAQSLTELRFADGAEQVIFKYGALPTGTTIPRPNVAGGESPFYLIDVDLIDLSPHPLSVDDTVATLRRYNANAYRLFRWSITPEYEEELRGA